MSCCSCNRGHRTKPSQNDLTNLEYLELLSTIDQMIVHAKEHHTKELWKCKWLLHDWFKVTDAKYNTHSVCHRCGQYQPVYRSGMHDVY